jgi:hypothetical protein
MTNDLTTRCSESILVGEDDSDWLHSNPSSIPHVRSLEEMQNGSTSAGGHAQKSFIERPTYSEKKRQRDSSEKKRQRQRERYSAMTDGQKETFLHNNREYKKRFWKQNSALVTSPCTHVMQTEPFQLNPTGIAGS